MHEVGRVYKAGGWASHRKTAGRKAAGCLEHTLLCAGQGGKSLIETSRLMADSSGHQKSPISGCYSKAPAHAVMARFCGSNLGSGKRIQPAGLCEASLGASPIPRESLGHWLWEFPHDLLGYGLQAQ